MIDLPPTNRLEAPEVDRPLRLGVVSFLNTLPLIDGLDRLADVELQHSVPSGLIDQLIDGHVDVALCSIVDYQRSPEPLVLVPSGLLGCHGRTMTVRLYSTRPIDQIQTVYCDTDSHTSIALMQVLLSERYGVRPTLIDYNAREHVAENRPIDWPDSVLLIGDKVVTDSPPAVRYTHQLDLGEAWNDFTGLPFVFAGWLARRDTPPDRLAMAAAVLDRVRRRNRAWIDGIIHRHADARRWPADLAREYLGELLDYEWSDAHRQAIERFFDSAGSLGLIDHVRPLECLELTSGTWS